MRINNSYLSPAEESLKSITKALEPYRIMSDSFSSNMMKNSLVVPKFEFDIESLREAMKLYKDMNKSFLQFSSLTDSISDSLREIGKSFKLSEQADVSKSLKEISDSMNLFSKSIDLDRIRQLNEIDYSAIFADIMPKSSSLSQMVDSAYSMIEDELSEKENLDENFTEEEIQETLHDQATNPKGFQERVASWTEKKKIQFFIIWQLISFLYGNFLQPYFQENIGMPVTAYVVSNVKELPQKGADVICQLKEEIEAIIIENTNYYYKVFFIDENGEEREGYVAKRNLKKVNKEIEEQQE